MEGERGALFARGHELTRLHDLSQVAIERLNGNFRQVAGELSHRMSELGKGETMRNRLKQQADLYYSSQTPSQALKDEIEGEYLESKARKPNEEAENARRVGKGSYVSAKPKRPEPKRLVKKTKEDVVESFISDFSKLSVSELDEGVINMLIRGLIPSDVDLGKAFDSDFFTLKGITPAKVREGKTAKQMLQDYVDSMVKEEQAFGDKLHQVALVAQRKRELEKDRILKYGSADIPVNKRYSMMFLDAQKLLPGKRKSMIKEEGGERKQHILNEEEQFFAEHHTFKKAYKASMAALGDGYLPILQYRFLRTMPDFRLFKAKNSLSWKKIEAFLPRVCEFCKERSIFLAAVPWRKLFQIAAISKGNVTDYDLYEIVVNLYELWKELNNETSATKIQAAYKVKSTATSPP